METLINSSIIPFFYQEPVIDKLVEFVKTNKGKSGVIGFIVMPGGSGKTVVFSDLIRRLKLKKKAVILSPTLPILDQNVAMMRQVCPDIPISVCSKETKDLSGDIIFSTYHSFVNLLKNNLIAKDFVEIIIFDEVHASLSEKRSQIPEKLDAICLGFTATDKYSEQKNVERIFKNEIYRMSLKEAIEMGILLPLRGYIVETEIDLTSVKLTKRSQLDEKAAEKYLAVIARNQAARDFYLKELKGVSAVAFCITVKHAIEFAQYLRESGIRAEAIHSHVPTEKRREILQLFDKGEIDIICSRDILAQGWDSKRVVAELNLRPTYSWVYAEQRICRVVRKVEGKTCGIVVEFQDIYNKKDQHILVHHLFGSRTYAQGGYVHAPARIMTAERKSFDSDYSVEVFKGLNIKVSSVVRKVVDLRMKLLDNSFKDKKLVRDILLSKQDIDYRTLSKSRFLDLEFNHPKFKGRANQLIAKYLGILWNGSAEEYKYFIEDVLGDYHFYEQFVPSSDAMDSFQAERCYESDTEVMLESLSLEVRRSLATLTERECMIVRYFYGLLEKTGTSRGNYYAEMQFSEHLEKELVDKIINSNRPASEFHEHILMLTLLSDDLNLTRERCRQILAKAIRRLRHSSRSNLLQPYLA